MSYAPFGLPGSDPEEQVRVMQAHLNALQALQEHPGWGVVVQYIEGELRGVISQLSNISGQTGETALKASVAFALLSKIKDLPKELEQRLMQSLAPLSK